MADVESAPPLSSSYPGITVERTLAIIKPDAIEQADEIIEVIKEKGFTILQVRDSPVMFSESHKTEISKKVDIV